MRDRAADDEGMAKPPHDAVIHLRISEDEQTVMDARWRAEGFKNRSAYVRHLIRSDVGAPSSIPQIVKLLTETLSQLGSIGRNINQTTRAIHVQAQKGVAFNPLQLTERDDLLALKEHLPKVRNSFKAALRSYEQRSVGRP